MHELERALHAERHDGRVAELRLVAMSVIDELLTSNASAKLSGGGDVLAESLGNAAEVVRHMHHAVLISELVEPPL